MAALTSLLVLVAACRKESDPATTGTDRPAALAEDGTDSAAAETDAEIVTSSLVAAAAAGGALTLASAGTLNGAGLDVQGLGDGAKAVYFPRNCLGVTSDEAAKTVTYDFKDCSGPNAIFKINGIITARYETAPGKLVLNLVATELRINRALVDWSATAEITADGTARTMRWKGALSGTTARGKTFSRNNQKVVTWRFGERCFGVSGVSEGTVSGRFLRTEVSDYRRCQGGCPEAGGRITISNDAKLKVEIVYDGSNRATFSGPNGTTTFALACQG